MEHSTGVEAPGETGERTGRPRLTRRQVMGRAGAVATAGAVAWVVPEILVAQPGSAAGLSGTPGANASGSAGAGVSTPVGGGSAGVGVAAAAAPTGADGNPVAGANAEARARSHTGVDATGDPSSRHNRVDAGIGTGGEDEVGAALMASGWDLQHWSPNRG
jgi:hypothetical protein